MGTQQVRLVHPAGVARPPARFLAPRLASLAGTRLGLLDNAKPNAGALLGAVADALLAEGVSDVVRVRKRNPGMGASLEELRALRACDVVLLGTAD